MAEGYYDDTSFKVPCILEVIKVKIKIMFRHLSHFKYRSRFTTDTTSDSEY